MVSEVTVKVQGTIELRIRCNVCEEDLDIVESGYDRYGQFVVRVFPCDICMQEAIEEHLPSEDKKSSPFCATRYFWKRHIGKRENPKGNLI